MTEKEIHAKQFSRYFEYNSLRTQSLSVIFCFPDLTGVRDISYRSPIFVMCLVPLVQTVTDLILIKCCNYEIKDCCDVALVLTKVVRWS